MDGSNSNVEAGKQEKDRSWLMLSLHQIYSRRWAYFVDHTIIYSFCSGLVFCHFKYSV